MTERPQRITRLSDRRMTVPQALEDPEDCTIGEAEGDLFEERKQQKQERIPTAVTPPEISQLLPKEARNLLAGGFAGMTAKTVVAPLDRIKILYQVSSAHYHIRDVPRVAKNIIDNEGITALWKGNFATMIRIFPYSGIQFMVFDRIKSVILVRDHQYAATQRQQRQLASSSLSPRKSTRERKKYGLTALESLGAGMTAGTISVIFTYPLDLARAQLAVIRRHRHHPNRGFALLLKENYSQRGFAGLFRGMTPTLLGIIPYSGIAFALNEQTRREVR
jgi:hypothetical protein